MIVVHSEYSLGDMTVRYLLDEESRNIGWLILPTAKLNDVCIHRADLSGVKELSGIAAVLPISLQPWAVQPLVEFSLAGDAKARNLGQGQTLRRGSASLSMRFTNQETTQENGALIVVTECTSDKHDLTTRHYLRWRANEPVLATWSEIQNRGTSPVSLEMITSFNLGHITPFDQCDATERLFVHRLRSAWASEGRHEVRSIEELKLERSWAGHGIECERFGVVGTKPVGRWFPLVAVEDREAGAFWGAQLAWAGSWQMEVFRQDDFLAISGGLADREFGHWLKRIDPNEFFSTPHAYLSATDVGFDVLCSRLTSIQHDPADTHPEEERRLPILFNEWCTSWGHPNHESLVRLARACREYACDYLVIDAGWYADDDGHWDNAQGDWQPSSRLFPDGLEATCSEIRKMGVVPGLWFEFEVAGKQSRLWERTDLLLHRDGVPLEVGDRRFLDMRKTECHEYLEKNVLDLIDRCGIGYVKVDYNETLGIGVDGAESLGEGLRRHVEGVCRFFRRMKQRFPNVVIENCSSGGQRMEPSMIMLSAMTSFSDAHETTSIPIIAANVQRVILPRLCQVWCVLRKDDDERRLTYGLAAAFLGRMCLSGDLLGLTAEQSRIVRKAVDFYGDASDIILQGTSLRFGPQVNSYNDPKGWQAVCRYGKKGERILVVVHRFRDEVSTIPVTLQEAAGFVVRNVFSDSRTRVTFNKNAMEVHGLDRFAGCAVLLEKV